MITPQFILAITIFIATVVFLLWRPRGLNEAIPPAIGSFLLYFLGIVSLTDMKYVFGTISGAAITIISTMAMSIVLESMGFFRWIAFNLVARCEGSGIRLYWSVILLCFLMTMFFNNDGSIVITTPIIIEIVKILKLKPRQQFAYLLSGAIIATASSAPIGVSNLANLIALKIVGVDLVTHTKFMFVPSMMGLITISILFFFYFRKDIPEYIDSFSRACLLLYERNSLRPPADIPGHPLPVGKPKHPLPVGKHQHPAPVKHEYQAPVKHEYQVPVKHEYQVPVAKHEYQTPVAKQDSQPVDNYDYPLPNNKNEPNSVNWTMFKVYMTIIIIVRACLFIFSYYGIPIESVAIAGALLIILIRWYSQGTGAIDVLRKTPWHVFVFAFSMYLVVYGLHNVKFTNLIIGLIKEPVSSNLLNAILIVGTLTSCMASLFNNHPSLMLATTIITNMGLGLQYVQVTYLAIILGSDIGSLVLPSGTLASLIWMFILKKNEIHVTWREYISVTILIIPAGLLVSLLSLYLWVALIS